MSDHKPKQKLLPLELEETRLAKIERLLSKAPKQLTTGAKLFDFEQATAIARATELPHLSNRVVGDNEITGKDPTTYKARTYGRGPFEGLGDLALTD